MSEREKIICCLHNHLKSRFDAVDSIYNYLQAAVDAGYNCMAITDHGALTALQDAYDLTMGDHKEFDLKIIYGVEAYIELDGFNINKKTGHLIMMARDEQGRHAIDKMVSKAPLNNTGKPVFTKALLEEYQPMFKNHVFATSACIQGAPAMEFRINSSYQRQAEKIQAKIDKIKKPEFLEDEDEMNAELDEILNEVILVRDKINDKKKLSKKKFTAMEKKLAKMQEMGDPGAAEFEKELNETKKLSAQALEDAEKIKAEEYDPLWARKGVLEKVLKEIKEYKTKISTYERELQLCKDSMVDEDQCEAAAEKVMLYYDQLFGHTKYLVEVQYHGLPEEAMIYPRLAKLAKKHNIPIVAANDAHMAYGGEDDLTKRNVAMYLRFGKASTDEDDITNKELYIKSPAQLKEALIQILDEETVDNAINNANIVGALCNYVPHKVNHYPVFDKNKDSNELIRLVAREGANKLFTKEEWTDEYEKRFQYELDIIIKMGYSDYHLIVKDYLEYASICGYIPSDHLADAPLTIEGVRKYCEENNWHIGIGTGLGRGSAAGSLVCYCLGITKIDPLKYNLLFERYLNPERISMPDIDCDFKPDVREKTIEYVKNKYGAEAISSIMTESRMAPKGAIRDAGRYYGARYYNDDKMFLQLCNKMRKSVPDAVGTSFDTELAEGKTVYDMLCEKFGDDKNALKILQIAKACEGMFTAYGMHAAGVIISDTDDITNYIPLMYNSKKKRFTTQCNKEQCELNEGLLKMDFLGLKNLGIFTDTVQNIQSQLGEEIDLRNIPFEDEVFKEIYAKGKTKNVFQFESPGMRKYLKQLNPSNIEDIVAMNALYRPGPMDSIPEFIAAKK